MPTTSPAKASSASARSCAKKNCGLDSDMFLPVRTSLAFMPRLSLPEHSRANAMRSRWFGSILAWILNTKALIRGSAASTLRRLLSCARGGGAKRPQLERLAGFRDQREFFFDRPDVEVSVAASEFGNIDLLRRAGLGAAAF